MFDIKVTKAVLSQLEEERGIPQEKVIEAIEAALATAYKKEYGKRGQIIRSTIDMDSGSAEFFQVKIVVDDSMVYFDEEDAPEKTDEESSEEEKNLFNPEHHILIEDAKKIKKDAELEEELIFPLPNKDDFGRIASQTAKQVIIQKIREAEKTSVLKEFGEREGEIVSGSVQRIERGNIFIDMGRATGLLPYNEQIPGEKYRQGDRIRAYLFRVEESPRGVFLRLSRSHPELLKKLFESEAPEIASGVVEVKAISREPGSRSKIAVYTEDENIDPVGSLVGQRGVRVSTVMSELGGEKIDIIEWSEEPAQFIADALSPADVLEVEVDEEEKQATVKVSEDQQSLAIGKGGQNVRLAARLTGWKIDIRSVDSSGEEIVEEEKPEEEESKTPETTEKETSEAQPASETDKETKEAQEEKVEEEKEASPKEEVDKENEMQETSEEESGAEKDSDDETEDKK